MAAAKDEFSRPIERVEQGERLRAGHRDDDRRDQEKCGKENERAETCSPGHRKIQKSGDRRDLSAAEPKARVSNEDFNPVVIVSAAEIVRDFIENYHERSEEEAVFPRFKKAGKMVSLVDTLLTQHQAGRHVTEAILQTAPGSRKNDGDRKRLVDSIQSFINMYRPHAAREDTNLFPMLRGLVSSHEYDAMAEDFEKKEHQLFWKRRFRSDGKTVRQPRTAIRNRRSRAIYPALNTTASRFLLGSRCG
jgi:hemerythrin-like domain-containing protein